MLIGWIVRRMLGLASVLILVSTTAAQTVTINNKSGSGDITDFLNNGTSPVVAVDYNGDILIEGNGALAGVISGAEGTCFLTGSVAVDLLCPNATQHGWLMNNAGNGYIPVVGGPTSSTTGDVALFGGTSGGLLEDAGFLGTAVVRTASSSNVLGRSMSQSTTPLTPTPASGEEYTLLYYANQNAVCTSGSNSVSFTFNWTDASGSVRALTTGSLSLGTTQQPSGYLSGHFPIWVGSGSVTYTSTVVGGCSMGSYDIHVRLASQQ